MWPFSYPEPFLRAARRGALAKSITGYHENMVRKQYPVLELANQMPVRIWIWPEPLVAPRVRRALGTGMRCDVLMNYDCTTHPILPFITITTKFLSKHCVIRVLDTEMIDEWLSLFLRSLDPKQPKNVKFSQPSPRLSLYLLLWYI
jgi:hypothetical protein